MGVWGGGGRERGNWLPGFQVCVNPSPAISQLTGNVLKTFSQSYKQAFSSDVNRTLVQCYLDFSNVLKHFLKVINKRSSGNINQTVIQSYLVFKGILSFSLTPMSFRTRKSFVSLQNTIKIFWMKTGRLVTVPLTAK